MFSFSLVFYLDITKSRMHDSSNRLLLGRAIRGRAWCSDAEDRGPPPSSTRPDTRQDSRGQLGRGRNAKTACYSKIHRTDRQTEMARYSVSCPRLKIENIDTRSYGLVILSVGDDALL